MELLIAGLSHELRWRSVSPREILSFIASLLLVENVSPFLVEFDLSTTMSVITLSRDRILQIRRALSFPELDQQLDDYVASYVKFAEQENMDYSGPTNVSPLTNVFADFLLESLPRKNIISLFDEMKSLHVIPEPEQLMKLKLVRKSFRSQELSLWFAVQLLICVTRIDYARRKGVQCSALKIEPFTTLVIRSLFWSSMVPLSVVLPQDVHFLVKQRRNKSGTLRRLCCYCSARGSSSKKRTLYCCARCNKPFCYSDACFGEYHRIHNLRYYTFGDETFCLCSKHFNFRVGFLWRNLKKLIII